MAPDAAALLLAQRIQDLGARSDYPALAAIRDDPSTRPLLDSLPDPDRERADLVLRGVDRWLDSERRTALRRLTEAREALDAFDVDLAGALLRRVEDRLLDDEAREERDRLLLEVSARTMERESLAAAAERVVAETPRPRRRFFRRFFRRR